MKSEPVVLCVDYQKSFDHMKPMLERLLDRPRLIHCNTHKDAMDFIDSDQYADIIFAEWDLTGHSFIDSVRHDLENHNTPVIILSEDTSKKRFVLNSIDREPTFFLAKPFLERGLIKKFNKVLKVIERRREHRIHPGASVLLQIQFNENQQYTLPLVDLSVDGCLIRAPLDISNQISIYQDTQISLTIDEFSIQVHGEVYRIGQCRTNPDHKDYVLIMVKFVGPEQQDREVQTLLDELGKRW